MSIFDICGNVVAIAGTVSLVAFFIFLIGVMILGFYNDFWKSK
jgi:hypothetical protein